MFYLNIFILSFFILFSLKSLASETHNSPKLTEFKSPIKIYSIQYDDEEEKDDQEKEKDDQEEEEDDDDDDDQEEERLEIFGESLSEIEQRVGGFFLPEDVWRRGKELKDSAKIVEFMDWRDVYVAHLPFVIIHNKLANSEESDELTKQAYSEQIDPIENFKREAKKELYYAIHEERSSDSVLNLAKRFNYTQEEKLNLFIYLLHQRGSEVLETHKILELFLKWNIHKSMEVFPADYKDYIQYEGDFDQQSSDNQWFSIIREKPITTVLHELFFSQRYDVFLEIMNQYPDINVNVQDILGRSMLHLISGYVLPLNKEFFYTLIQQAHVNFQLTDMFGYTPLTTAMLHDSEMFEEFMMLPSNQIGLEIKDNLGRTPVFLALEQGLYDKAQTLYDKGATSQSGILSQQNVFIDNEGRALQVSHPMAFEFKALFEHINLHKSIYDKSIGTQLPIYGYLFKFLENLLAAEEKERANVLMRSLSGYKSQELEQETDTVNQLLKAVRLGDVHFLKTFFSDKKNQEYLHDHFFKKSLNKPIQVPKDLVQMPIGLNFDLYGFKPFLLGHFIIFEGSLAHDGVLFSTPQNKVQGLTLLSEAVRFNQDDVVEFLMNQGAQIASDHRSISYMLPNELVIGVLNGKFVYNSPYRLKVYQNIITRLVQDPQVTKSFLEVPMFFGLSLTDLAAVRGNLFALKLFYEKGARVSENLGIWGSSHLALSKVAQELGHYQVAIFIEQENLKRNPKNKMRVEFIKMCQLAFQ